MLESFHFIEPLWLVALIPLLLLAWCVHRPGSAENPWRRVVDAALLPLLMIGSSRAARRGGAPWVLAVAWTIAVLALADPTWERLSQPVYQSSAARVIVLDMSRSMYATDLAPSRLVRARYKVEDVLAQGTEGQTGLVVYAGDAFTVSPLTRDTNTIRALLKALDPSIMPVDGMRADLGLLKAAELLRQAGSSSGQVLLIADGVEAGKAAATERAAAQLREQGYRVSVLGVSSDAGGQTGAAGGGVDDSVIPKLDTAMLQSVARAGGGEYQQISASGEALKSLLSDPRLSRASDAMTTNMTTQAWNERGPLLVLLLIPLAALAFRRNWLLGGLLLIGLASPPQSAMASTWTDLWQRPEQQAANAMVARDYASASKLAQDPYRLGTALYKLGNYQKALDEFGRASGTDADYNRGNAFARLGRYQEAIAAYDKALKEYAGNEDALANKKAVEELLKKQQQNSASSSPHGASQRQQDKNQAGQQGSGQSKESQQGSGQGKESQQAKDSNGKKAEAPEKPQSPTSGTGNGQAAKSDEAQQRQAGNGVGNPDANASTAPPQKQSDNQFADAAKRLAAQNGNLPTKDDVTTPSPPAPTPAAKEALAAVGVDAQQAAGASASARELDSEEQMAAEQWLRRIPDDPGGLLRRKFLYQYKQRAQHSDDDGV